MPSTLPSTQAPPSAIALARLKYLLWGLMGMTTLSVIFFSEIPLLKRSNEQAALRSMLWLVVPHAIAGTLALLSGPFQFSSRLRRRNLKLHRVLGRLYVGAVFLAAPLAVAMAARYHHRHAIYFTTATSIQSMAWVIATGCALLTARARRIPQHRIWMIRSYGVTFTFVLTRVVQFVPLLDRLGRLGFACAIVAVTLFALLTPEIASCLRNLVSLRIKM
jgi:Predicted membrane protein (DUF2306)